MCRALIGIPVFIALSGCDAKAPFALKVINDFELEFEEGAPATGDPGGDDTGSPADPTDPIDPVDPTDPTMVSVDDHQELTIDLEVLSVDLALLLDTTGSMTPWMGALGAGFDDLTRSVEDHIIDPAYGYATFDDYNFGAMGTGDDRPFILTQAMTTSRDAVQRSINETPTHFGSDAPESTMEALYQGLTGNGYDQNGNRYYDDSTDILPFVATTSDAFGGTVPGTYDLDDDSDGKIGGFGFRSGSLPVIIYITDAELRDPDVGYATPGGSPFDAGSMDVIDASETAGARLIGFDLATSGFATSQMESLARQTGSVYDADGDGLVDDPLVFSLDYSMSGGLVPTIGTAIELMMEGLTFHEITGRIVGETYGFSIEVMPSVVSDLHVGSFGESADFSVSIVGEVEASSEDQIFPLTLEVYGDNTTLLGTHNFNVVVPATL